MKESLAICGVVAGLSALFGYLGVLTPNGAFGLVGGGAIFQYLMFCYWASRN